MFIKKFQKIVWDFYYKNKRAFLPWRKSITPYKVVVSEIMLQQTQVVRVVPFFNNWMKSFPNWQKLAEAGQSDVLRHWKGLGYNSRALRLHRLAKIVNQELGGKLPKTSTELQQLPSIGPYTAGAVRAFAYNEPQVFIETNIRTVFTHHFFADKKEVHDIEILEVIEKTLPKENFREWYWALMDYGTHLKKQGIKLNTKSKHYTKQSKFEGSDRQIRGKILEVLLEKKKVILQTLVKKLGEPKVRVIKILGQLENEKFLVLQKTKILLMEK